MLSINDNTNTEHVIKKSMIDHKIHKIGAITTATIDNRNIAQSSRDDHIANGNLTICVSVYTFII